MTDEELLDNYKNLAKFSPEERKTILREFEERRGVAQSSSAYDVWLLTNPLGVYVTTMEAQALELIRQSRRRLIEEALQLNALLDGYPKDPHFRMLMAVVQGLGMGKIPPSSEGTTEVLQLEKAFLL